MALDEAQRMLGDHIVGVGATSVVAVFGELYFPFAVIEDGRVVVVGMNLVQVAEEFIEAFLAGNAVRARIAQPPFSEASARISGTVQHLGNGDVLFEQGHAAGIEAYRS